MRDKHMLKWLNENMNKQNLFYFEDDNVDKDVVDCYLKNGTLFAIYNRDIIQIMIDEKIEIIN